VVDRWFRVTERGSAVGAELRGGLALAFVAYFAIDPLEHLLGVAS